MQARWNVSENGQLTKFTNGSGHYTPGIPTESFINSLSANCAKSLKNAEFTKGFARYAKPEKILRPVHQHSNNAEMLSAVPVNAKANANLAADNNTKISKTGNTSTSASTQTSVKSTTAAIGNSAGGTSGHQNTVAISNATGHAVVVSTLEPNQSVAQSDVSKAMQKLHARLEALQKGGMRIDVEYANELSKIMFETSQNSEAFKRMCYDKDFVKACVLVAKVPLHGSVSNDRRYITRHLTGLVILPRNLLNLVSFPLKVMQFGLRRMSNTINLRQR